MLVSSQCVGRMLMLRQSLKKENLLRLKMSICSALSKVMESMVNFHLIRYLESKSLLNDRQYGFRRGRPMGYLQALLPEKWCNSIHHFGESKVVALDISKAFDRVWHVALLSKCIALGVGDNSYRFLSSFLRDRTIRFVIDEISSNEFKLNSAVPQGSVFSLTLFLIFVKLSTLSILSRTRAAFAILSHSAIELACRRLRLCDKQ